MLRRRVIHLLLLESATLAAAGAWATPAGPSMSAEQVYAEVSPSVVVVLGTSNDEEGSLGSGVVVAREKVVTNCHVLQGQQDVKVDTEDQELAAQVSAVDWRRDVCVLSVPGLSAKPVRLGRANALRVGQKVYAIGSPEGLASTLSDGLVSGFREFDYGVVIQVTAPISHGSSGGGLFDDRGNLVGITTLVSVEGQNLNFAHPVDWVAELMANPRIGLDLAQSDPPPDSEEPSDAPSDDGTPVRHLPAALLRRFNFSDARVINVGGAPALVGKVTNHSGCSVSGIQVKAAFRLTPGTAGSIVYTLEQSIYVSIRDDGSRVIMMQDEALADHTGDAPIKGRWWPTMEVVDAYSAHCN